MRPINQNQQKSKTCFDPRFAEKHRQQVRQLLKQKIIPLKQVVRIETRMLTFFSPGTTTDSTYEKLEYHKLYYGNPILIPEFSV